MDVVMTSLPALLIVAAGWWLIISSGAEDERLRKDESALNKTEET